MFSPSDYITRIEEMFDQCRRDQLDRFSIEWGKFSREMNLELQTDIQNAKDPVLRSRYNFIFVFWIEMSKCLNEFIPDLRAANEAKAQALSKDPIDFDLDEPQKMELIFGKR